MTTVSFQLSDDDVRRIAGAVAVLVTPRGHRWLDVKAASEYTSLSDEAIRTAHKRGRLRGHKGESGRLVFTTDDLDAYMESPE